MPDVIEALIEVATRPWVGVYLRVLAVVLGYGAIGHIANIADYGDPTPTPTTPRRGGNPEVAKVQHPVAATPESVARGRMCSQCHRIEGRGDGGGAGGCEQPADFTDDVWGFGSTDGEIFFAVGERTSADMQSYARLIADEDIWHLVNYLRS